MIIMESSITINAPLQKVWETINDFEGIQNWSSRVKKSWLISKNKSGINCERVCKVPFLGNLKEVVFEWEEMNLLGYYVRNIPLIKTFQHVWRFESKAEYTIQFSSVKVESQLGLLNSTVERKVLTKRLPIEINNLVTDFKFYVENGKPFHISNKNEKEHIKIISIEYNK